MLDASLDRLNNPDPVERILALEDLVEWKSEQDLAIVAARLLADADAGVRETAARILVEISTHEAARRTAPHIASADITVRNLAGEVLVRIGAAAVEVLAPYIDDENHDVRKFALDLLALLPAGALADRIAAHLTDEVANVRIAAVEALGVVGASAYAPDLKEIYVTEPAVRPSVLTALSAFGPEHGLDLVEKALSDAEPVVQYAAAEALSEWDVPEVLDTLLRKVDEVNPIARPVMLHSMLRLYERHSERVGNLPAPFRNYFLDMLDDLDPTYQQDAVHGLRYFLDDETVETLLSHTGQNDTLDVDIFQVVASYPNTFRCLLRTRAAGRMDRESAAQFLLVLLSQHAIPVPEMPVAAAYLQREFDTLSVETRLAAINVCLQLEEQAFDSVLQAGRASPDDTVRSFTTEAV